MSNETIKQVGLASSPCKDDDKSLSSVAKSQYIPNSTSKAPISVLSPHVAEFVPKSFALKKESQSSPKSATGKCLGIKSAMEVPFSDIQGVDKLSGKPGEGDERSSRGWWEEAPLKIEIDGTATRNATRNAPKPQHHKKGSPERTHRQPREKTTGYSWGQERHSEDLNFNWRLRPSHNDQEKPKDNELGLGRGRKETRKKDLHVFSGGIPQDQEHYSLSSSFEGKKVRNESRSDRKDVIDGEQQKQQRQQGRVMRGASRGRGRGRGRIAWMNDAQDQNNRNYEPKNLDISDQKGIKKVGHSHGFRSITFNHIDSAVTKGTSNSGDVLTHSKHRDPEVLMRKGKETDGSSTAEEDGWIVVGNKKKMDEQKSSESKTKEKISIENRFSGKLKEMKERDDKMTGLNSQQKVEKWKRKWDQKKERKADNTEQERKSVQNKETTEVITAKKFRKQDEAIKGKSKVVFKSENDGNERMESESKSNQNKQEKEPRKAEIVKIIKTEQNSKEVKILLKKNNDSQILHDDPTVHKDPGFDLQEGDDEFPDLATSNKVGTTSLASDWLSGGSRMPIVSYSAVLKAMPKPKTQPVRNSPNNEKSSSTMQDHDENEVQSKKKKKKKKKKAKGNDGSANMATQEPKKTKQPMQFDLGDWLSTIEKRPPKINKDKQTQPKKAVTITTGVLQIRVKDQPSAASRAPAVKATHGLSTTDKTFHNILDSTAPVVKRGKEREVPKKKKPSQLKRIILKEREEKRKALEGEETQEEKSELQSLVEEHSSSEETNDEPKSEDKLSNEDNEVTVNQSKDDVMNHHHENANATSADLSSDGDKTVAPSEDDVKAQIHSRRFREYCDNVMDKELNNTTLQLLQKLVLFQDRQYHKDPVKSKAKRRFVVGLREVTKHLKLKKIKLVIVSPNVERIKSAGGLDDTLHNIISIAHQNGVPVVFALRRQVLGRVLHKKVPVSALGVFYYDGAEDEYKKLMDLTEKAREVYAQRWKAAYDELVEKIHRERAEELLQDAQEEDSTPHEKCEEETPSEIPNGSKNEIKKENNTVPKDTKDSNIKGLRKMENDKESEFSGNQENEWEREEEMKDELLDEKENSTEGSEDDNNLETVNAGSEKVEQDETNEMNERDNDSQCVSTERDLTVEEL